MEHLLTQFQTNLQAIQDDLIENFPMMNGSIATMDGLKLDYWNDVPDDVSFMMNDIQAQLDAQVPIAVEAMEIETALRESMARSMDSAFEVLYDAAKQQSKPCVNLAGLYRAAQMSNTNLKSRLDEFYTCCKRRRTQHQHGLLEDMNKSLSRTRNRAVNRCTKHLEATALNSKSRIRRLALRQQPQVPGDIQAIMNGVLGELQSFLDEVSSQRGSSGRSEAPSSSRTAAGLEKALSHFFMDVSSGKAPSSNSAGGSEPIRDQFSTLTEPDAVEIQEAYYSCQYPIVDFPPDLVGDANGADASQPPSPEPEAPPSPPPPPSPPSSSGDSMLGDFEVIEELDNLPGKGSSSDESPVDAGCPEAMETEAPVSDTISPPDEGGGVEQATQPEAEAEEEKIFIDLCDEAHHSDVEYLFEDCQTPSTKTGESRKEECEEELMKDDKREEEDEEEDDDRLGTHGRNIFEVLQRTSPARWSGSFEASDSTSTPQPSKSTPILMQTSAEAFYADPAMVQEVEAAVQSITCDPPTTSSPSTPSSGTVLTPLEAMEQHDDLSTEPGESGHEEGSSSEDAAGADNAKEADDSPDFSKSLSSLASQLMALRNSDGSFNVPTIATNQNSGNISKSKIQESDALKLQLVNVLDRMVELCEAPGVEGGDETRSRMSISARLDLMLRESFNLVASNRVGQAEGAGAWHQSIDKTCADFQSQMSAALSSFLMSPASECGPIPSVTASDRVAAWDFPPSNEPLGSAPDALSELEVGPGLPSSPDVTQCPSHCRPIGQLADNCEEQQGSQSSPVSTMPAPITPEFLPNDGEEQAAATVEPPPCEKPAATFESPVPAPKPTCPVVVDTQESSVAKSNDSFVDNDRINDDEILEVIFGTTEPEVSVVENSSFYTNREFSRWSGFYCHFFRSEENEEARRAQWLLLCSGASLFDPYHPHLIGASSRLAVFIHIKDVNYSHRISNLLQLKNMRQVAFKVYENSTACSLDECREIFPAGSSCLVLDRDTVASTHPDNLVSLITFVREECQLNRPCRIVLHRQLYRYLSDISVNCESRTELYRLERLKDLLTNPKQDGIIQWAGSVGPEIHVDPLQFMLDIQKRFQHECRDFFLLTNIDANDLTSHIFARDGFSVMSINQFIINYTTKPYNAYSCANAANLSMNSDLSEDAPLSWCMDILPSVVGCPAVI